MIGHGACPCFVWAPRRLGSFSLATAPLAAFIVVHVLLVELRSYQCSCFTCGCCRCLSSLSRLSFNNIRQPCDSLLSTLLTCDVTVGCSDLRKQECDRVPGCGCTPGHCTREAWAHGSIMVGTEFSNMVDLCKGFLRSCFRYSANVRTIRTEPLLSHTHRHVHDE